MFSKMGEGREGLEETEAEEGGWRGLGKQKPDSRGISLHFASAGSHHPECSMGL